jgi:hypothetical protein
LSLFKTTPKRIQSFIEGKGLYELNGDSDTDVPPAKRRRPATLPIRAAKTSVSEKSTNNQTNQDARSKTKLQPKAAKSFQQDFTSTLDSSGEDNDLFKPASRKRIGQSLKPTSTNALNIDLSDTLEPEDGEDSEANSDVSDSNGNLGRKSKALERSPKRERGNQIEKASRNEAKTKATPWLNRLVRLRGPK